MKFDWPSWVTRKTCAGPVYRRTRSPRPVALLANAGAESILRTRIVHGPVAVMSRKLVVSVPKKASAAQPHRATTAASVESIMRVHAYPTFGARRLASIRTSEVQAWLSGLELPPSTVAVV